MTVTMTDLYSSGPDSEEQLYQMKQLRRQREENRAKTMARLIEIQRKNIKKTYKQKIANSALATKTALGGIKGQVETAITGDCQDKIEQVVSTYLSQYDEIV